MNSFKSWNTEVFNKKCGEQDILRDSKLDKSEYLGCPANDQSKRYSNKKKTLVGHSMDKSDRFDSLRKTTNKLMSTNFSHHDPITCVCDSCNCGRHLCKLHNVKPDLSKSSIYQQSYPKKSPVPNIINRASQYKTLQGPHIGMDSKYSQDFTARKSDKNQKLIPEDLLKVGGPSPNLTSYGSQFPGFKGGNQYVKPTDQHIRADFPMRAKSTYAKSFTNRSAPKIKGQKIPDNLKSGNLWMGKTTYGNFFNQPNPEDYPSKAKNIQKLETNPNFGRQFETTYKNSFITLESTVCPAKQKLQTKIKGVMNSSKQKFNENSDFKSFNPTYHSISTSKHCYV